MKKLLTLLLLVLVLPSVLAINLTVEEISSENVVIAGLDKPVKYNLELTNTGNMDKFRFYNLLGFTMEPSEKISIGKDATRAVELVVYPRDDLDVRNYYTFSYFIRADADDSEISEKLTMKIIDLEDAFEIGSGEIDPESNTMDIYIHNKENFNFEDLNVKFSSKFFEYEETIDLDANKRKDFSIELDKEDFKEVVAGFYTLAADLSIENITAEIEGIIKFTEKGLVETEESSSGFIINTQIIEKTNTGNTLTPVEMSISKNIVSRLFTSFNPEPTLVERDGSNVLYTWSEDIKPGESLKVTVKTNWLFPLIIVALIIVIIVLVKQFTKTDLILRKRVSFVKAKGGEFALKVTINVQAKNYVERVNIVDRLPSLMKIYEKFGAEAPSRVNEKARLIEWNYEKLEAGEVRTLSYIIYSKSVGIMGKFALPAATAIYNKEGKIKDSESNRAFFVAEQQKKAIEFVED